MAISFKCDQCGKKLKAPDELAGRKIKCPGCQAVVRITAPEELPEESPSKLLDLTASSSPSVDDEAASDDPFAGDWLNSDELEDPRARKERTAARKAQLDAKRAEREAEEEEAQQRKKKSKASAVKVPAADPDEGQPFRYHWIYLLALLPLALSMLWPQDSMLDRLNRTFESHPEITPLDGEFESVSDLLDSLNGLPDHKIEGALLARDSLVHWVFGAVSAGAYLGLLFGMFPGTRRRTFRLLRVGLFTGTIGIVMLLMFQSIAHASGGYIVRGRGVGVLIFLILQLIGFSYRCAEDPSIGFWGSFFGFTVGVGLCEELCKSLPIWHYLRTARKTGWRGACLTGLASGIGFGVSEGIMYSGDMYNGASQGLIYVVRFVSCVSLHAMWSGSVALMMYRNQDFLDADEWGNVVLGLLYYISISMILHGLYDTLLKHDLDWVALLIGIGTYLWMLYLVRDSRGT